MTIFRTKPLVCVAGSTGFRSAPNPSGFLVLRIFRSIFSWLRPPDSPRTSSVVLGNRQSNHVLHTFRRCRTSSDSKPCDSFLYSASMRWVFVGALLAVCPLIIGCDSSPTSPAPLPPTPACTQPTGSVSLTVLVMGHITNRPLAGVPVSLVGFTCEQKTGDDGKTSWMVTPGTRVTFLVRGEPTFRDAIVPPVDAQWLVSFPE